MLKITEEGPGGGGPDGLSALQSRMKERGYNLYMSGVISEGRDTTRTMVAHNCHMKSTQNYKPITSIEENFGDIKVASRIIL